MLEAEAVAVPARIFTLTPVHSVKRGHATSHNLERSPTIPPG